MSRPVRLRLSRQRGFDLQALSLGLNGLPAVKVTRPSIFGNPCSCDRPYGCPHDPKFEHAHWENEGGQIDALRCCVDAFAHYVETGLRGDPTRTGRLGLAVEAMAGYPNRARLIATLPRLRGHNLACWCALDAPRCHADVLIEIANREAAP